jgi:hypothetical protein
MELAPRHIVTMVAAVSAAVVLAPVGVMAATGSLVNITDPFSSSRQARVSADGSLRVESRAAVSGYTFNVALPGTSSLSFYKLVEATGPYSIAVTDLSAAADTGLNQAAAGYAVRMEFVALTRTSGTAACAYNASGWTRKTLRWMDVAPSRTDQLSFASTPIVVPGAAAGHLACLGVQLWVMPSNTSVFIAAAGYKFVP